MGSGLGWAQGTVVDGGSDLTMGRGTFEVDDVGFSCMPHGSIPSGHDVGISSPNAVDQCSSCLAAEAVECRILNFHTERSTSVWPLVRIFDHLLWLPYGIGQTIIFSCCGLFFLLLSSFFSSPNLSSRRFNLYHTSAHGVVLV